VRELILVRHAHALSNVAAVVSSVPPGVGLSDQGREEALTLRETLAYEEIDLGIASQLLRTQETLSLALGGRQVPTTIFDGLNEINFGAYEGGPLAAYRTWAWTNEPDDECPGGGESRTAAAIRFAAALDVLVEHPEERILVVSHALPLRYVIDASDGTFPASRIDHVDHAVPFVIALPAVVRAAATLRAWAEAPRFTDAESYGPDLDVGDLDRA
jgi:broad specificity phosphatase PhoE